MYVGIFAYALTHLKRSDILFSAAGISSNGGYPTWLSPWHAKRQLFLSRGMGNLKLPISNPYHEAYMSKERSLFNMNARRVHPKAKPMGFCHKSHKISAIASMFPGWSGSTTLCPSYHDVQRISWSLRWDAELGIASSTGALILNLTLVLRLSNNTRCRRVPSRGHPPFIVGGDPMQQASSLYLWPSPGVALDKIVEPGDGLSMMFRPTGEPNDLLYLILRPVPVTSTATLAPQRWCLVAVLHTVAFLTTGWKSRNPSRDGSVQCEQRDPISPTDLLNPLSLVLERVSSLLLHRIANPQERLPGTQRPVFAMLLSPLVQQALGYVQDEPEKAIMMVEALVREDKMGDPTWFVQEFLRQAGQPGRPRTSDAGPLLVLIGL